MAEPSEESAFSKLPPKLQESFFELAEYASKRISENLKAEESKLAGLRKLLCFRKILGDFDDSIRVGVVDGSISPRLSERIGFRIGVYAASYMVFDGNEIISDEDDEAMEAGYIMSPQTGSPLHTKKILALLSTLLERRLALRCMKKYGVDLMIIDGSFYGFRARCSEIKGKRFAELGLEGTEIDGVKSGEELVNEIYAMSRELKRSGKAVAVIKRIRTSAIDGWLISRSWRLDEALNRNDKAILRALMKPGEYFDYDDLTGSKWRFLHYSALKGWFHEVEGKVKNLSGLERVEKALEYVDGKLRLQIVTDLAPSNASEAEKEAVFKDVIGTKRVYARLSRYAPPACIEFGTGVDVDFVLSYFMKWSNPATGLPFPLDLIDAHITLDRRLAIEFADEVEARLLLNPDLDVDNTYGEFESINPQKME